MMRFLKDFMSWLCYCLIMAHEAIKQFVFYIISVFSTFIYQLLAVYNSIKSTLGACATSFINHSFLEFSSFLKFLSELYLDIFSFENKLIKTYFLLLFIVIISISSAFYYNNSIVKKVFLCLFIIFYTYVVVLISSVIFLIMLYLENIFCEEWYIFLEDYQNSFTYKLLIFYIIFMLSLYDFTDDSSKKQYIPVLLFLLFTWFTHCFIYEKLNITTLYVQWWSPYGKFFFSLAYNVYIYEILCFLGKKICPEYTIHIFNKLDKWLEVVSPKVLIKNITPKKWLYTWFLITYIFFILVDLI